MTDVVALVRRGHAAIRDGLPRAACRLIAGRPRLRAPTIRVSIHQLEARSAARCESRPPTVAVVAHLVHHALAGVLQLNQIRLLRQPAAVIAQHGDARMHGLHRGGIPGHDEISAGREHGVGREIIAHAMVQAPAGQVHRVRAAIKQLDPFLFRAHVVVRGVAGRGLVHDFIDDDIAVDRHHVARAEAGRGRTHPTPQAIGRTATPLVLHRRRIDEHGGVRSEQKQLVVLRGLEPGLR